VAFGEDMVVMIQVSAFPRNKLQIWKRKFGVEFLWSLAIGLRLQRDALDSVWADAGIDTWNDCAGKFDLDFPGTPGISSLPLASHSSHGFRLRAWSEFT
jgi:hypothetical protein